MKNNFLNHILVGLAIISFASCNPDTVTPVTPAPTDTNKTVRITNLPYGSDSRNTMNVILPQGRTPSMPFVILIHGGGWNSGDKNDFAGLQDSLLMRNIGSVSINYRYASATNHYEGLMEDVRKALDLVISKSDEWYIRDDDYAMAGYSAGGHMALLYGYKYDTANHVSAIINCAGPTDLTYTDWLNYAVLIGQIGTINNMVGAEYINPLPARFGYSSPITGVKNVPTLTIHGTNDWTVSYEHALRLENELNSKSIDNKKVPLEGVGHDLGLSNPATLQLILSEMETWIKTKS